MVTRILRLDAPPKPADAADALALAITHIWRGGAQATDRSGRDRRGRQQEQTVIAFVRGEVAALTLTSAVLEVGGVGLELMCTPGTLATLRVGPTAMLPTSMVVREDSLTVFGFLDDDEKQIFELVQTASGVGPKVAQAMVAVLSPDDLRAAVAGEDVKTLTRVPGIGQKGAQRIILELKDRIGAPTGARLAGQLADARCALARPGAPGPRRTRLVGQGGRAGGRGGRARCRRQPRRTLPAARCPARAEQGVTGMNWEADTEDELDTRPRPRTSSA